MSSNLFGVPAPKKDPIVFFARGHTPDVRLRVFDQEFHVHTVILKLHSNFFYKFFESPEKDNSGPLPFGCFKYEWNTVLSEDKSDWALEALKPGQAVKIAKSAPSHLNTHNEIETFNRLMCSFYGARYDLPLAEDIIDLTRLADYYCALPKVSSTIYAPLFRKVGGFADFWTNQPRLLESAYKLRQPELFRDCLCAIAGDWMSEQYQETIREIGSPVLRKTITMVRNSICAKIVQAQEDIIMLADESDSFGARMMAYSTPLYEEFSLPAYYRKVSHFEVEVALGDMGTALHRLDSLRALLYDTTKLLGLPLQAAGMGWDSFFCGEIEDEDLPWNPKQLDW